MSSIVDKNKDIFIEFAAKAEQLHCMKAIELPNVGTETYIDYIPSPATKSFIQSRKVRITISGVYSALNNGWSEIEIQGCKGKDTYYHVPWDGVNMPQFV